MDKIDISTPSLYNSPVFTGFETGIAAEVMGRPASANKAKARGETRAARRSLFSEMLDNAESAGELGPLSEFEQSEDALTELMDTVHSAGSDLAERPFQDEIVRYKKAVRNFIHYVIKYGFELQKIQGIKKKVVSRGETEWKTAIYHQVQVVDKKLEELAAAILSGQTTLLERVSKVNEIKGLLVDLTVTGVIRERDD